MKRSSSDASSHKVLRKRAEVQLHAAAGKEVSPTILHDTQALVHELQVHQIELEMQNDELRRAQVEMGRLGDRYRDLFDFSPVGYVTLDSEFRIVEANLAAALLLGNDGRDLRRKKFVSFLDSQSREAFLFQCSQAIECDHKAICDVSFVRDDGRQVHVQAEMVADKNGYERSSQLYIALLDITKRVLVEKDLLLMQRQYAAVANLCQRVLLQISDADLLAAAARLITQTLEVEFSYILRVNPNDTSVIVCAGEGWRDGVVGRARLDLDPTTMAGMALLSGAPVVVNDIYVEGQFSLPVLLRSHGIRSGVCITIQGQYEPFGVLGVFSREPDKFSARHIHLMQAVAYTIATTIERNESERSTHANYDVITRKLDSLTADLDQAHFIDQAFEVLLAHTHSECAAFWFADEEKQNLTLRSISWRGTEPGCCHTGRPAASESLSVSSIMCWSTIFDTCQPLILRDRADLRLFPRLDQFGTVEGTRPLVLVPIAVGKEAFGILSLQFPGNSIVRTREIKFIAAIAQQVSLAVHIERLVYESRETAVLHERNRIAREIHDTLAQGFTGTLMQLKSAENDFRDAPRTAQQHLAIAIELARSSLAEARRSVMALRPSSLENGGLPNALAELVTQLTSIYNVPVNLNISGEMLQLSVLVESNLLRIAQEALANSITHARAKTLQIGLTFHPDTIQLVVADDGRGFEPALQAGIGHFGLQVMRERVEEIDGEFQMSSGIGKGTRIAVTIPTTDTGGT